ncbi:amidase [Mycobacterium sp. CBMA271]|uniref:amidase n=1 Tax=unclassified Mycobacteroides TaxID=2618759 RepID=UPI001321BDA1|nr:MULTISPECIES: amidase [unclassified Mycobacteroides]MUM18764.1 amidase [Mycobacteroides sp. CBMA 326]MUM22727.1 amidase [Mycobacteroides sp. CBMA 271]
MDFTEYSQYDATGLAELVATKQVTPAELLAAARARAEAVNGKVNAIIRDIPEADQQVTGELTGAFAGVPFLIKDLHQDYKGHPTAGGCRALSTLPAQEHATIVQRWLDAGLVIFGKTNTPEFGAKGITEPELFGPTRNPWDLNRTPGGSSGGSAAAVAAGIVPVAGASDGGGSIRIPAACCGLVGIKPGRGLTPQGPAFGEPMHGAAVAGTVSRTVRDAAAMLDVIVGPEPTSPYLPAVSEDSYASQVGRDPGKLRIGVRVPTVITPNPDPAARAAVDNAVRVLTHLGHEVVEVSAPYDDGQLARDFLLTWFVFAAYEVDDTKALTGAGDEGFERDTLLIAALGRSTSGPDYVAAVERRHNYVRELATFFGDYDLLLTPTLAKIPPKIGEFNLPAPLAAVSDVLLRTKTARLLKYANVVDSMINDNLGWVPYTQLANLTGRPAISLPLYQTPQGLPLGVQFVAPLGGESLLIRLAAQLEATQPWADRRPTL